MIARIDLERFLDDGRELGFEFFPEDPNRRGWILLWKRQVDERYLSLLEPGEDLIFVRKQNEIKAKPYVLQLIELERAKHEDQFYQEEFDRNDIYRFPNLDAVQLFLDEFDKNLEEIKWRIEIDAP